MAKRKHAHWRLLVNSIEPDMCGGEAAFFSKYFDHLLLSSFKLLGRIAVLRTYMRPTVADRVAWSVGRSVCLSH